MAILPAPSGCRTSSSRRTQHLRGALSRGLNLGRDGAQARNRPLIAEVISPPNYLNQPGDRGRAGLTGKFARRLGT